MDASVAKAIRDHATRRLAIEGIEPEIDGGRFAAKTVVDTPFEILADVFSDGHEVIGAAVITRKAGEKDGHETRMHHVENDRWAATVRFHEIGAHTFTIVAWRDLFGTWRRDTAKKIAAAQAIDVEIEEAKVLLRKIRPRGDDALKLKELRRTVDESDEPGQILMSEETAALMKRIGPRANLTTHRALPVWVDRELAAFSAWYELFPRSLGPHGEHGTFDDVIDHLPYVRDLGFDVLYFPPIHPIGRTNRKGKNNSLTAEHGDVGSPYAIGSDEGGMFDVHPDLGTLEDFDRLVKAAADHGLEIALDIALNASPDHPWVKSHPHWFERRPDGTIKYAENPPKKYEDIVNFRYYMDDGKPNAEFWEMIRDLFLFWAERGVLCFRVDNPHTKPFPFWEWIIDEVRKEYPEAIFLSEAFTRPKVMKRLAKLGFNQSYSYFTWRNTKEELTEYLTELTTEECRHTMRPNFFVNTPDINPVFLQTSGRSGFRTRLVLASSLAGSFGVYSGYEFCESEPLPGREEYLHSEKYEIKDRDWDAEGNIKGDIALMNRIRKEETAMRHFTNLHFYPAHDDRVLFYGKMDDTSGSFVLFHVLLDPHHPAEFGFEVPLWHFGLPDNGAVEVQDLIHGNFFTWNGKDHTLYLDPHDRPYAIWKLIPQGGAQ
ncbi:alpha-1,4-glucan--maltose-1-phosphate maltosyltransferase [Tranquillimonas alkanivorans]|uniref:Alpha-1,4-glucan:maltose-1-phosphate maltosyltransferase n=1 Tax=Tranquillimonas alkanivorans TaxID=441119 RepID=A0A1I5S1Z6_9RHOB|nr:alpha-1,4-glucan--maltose-1-phosphate maltosyltransferase [Tranquillimonas alkanivorans]SFP64765.1 alpha-1,4-glucan:maltose-1-phosphate maltosyltransferase [Tranquillimonas alkanivorans]